MNSPGEQANDDPPPTPSSSVERLPSFEWGVVDKLRRSLIAHEAHTRARFIWARTANGLSAAISVAGAFSGGSAIGDLPGLAIGLGVATALLSGLHAGLQPATKAAEHRVASVGFNEIVGQIQLLLIDRESSGRTDWSNLRPDMIELDKRMIAIEGAAPHVNPRDDEIALAKLREKLILGVELTDADSSPSKRRWSRSRNH